MSQSVIVCVTPRNDEGQYYCPYCGYTTDDIENMAVGMCWDCIDGEVEEVYVFEQG